MTLRHWKLGNSRAVALDRPAIIAILNLTPDSFSDGGDLTSDHDAARAAREAVSLGASMLDIGGESTRPGASRVPAQQQIDRVVPAIRRIRAENHGVPISIDTTLATVAAAALDAGADAVNDVSAGVEDRDMLTLVSQRRSAIILMHRLRAPGRDRFSDQYTHAPEYAGGVVNTVAEFLAGRAAAAISAGIDPASIVIDPGLGFGKTVEQNLELIRGNARLAEVGFPVLSALSRKSFTARAAGLASDTPPKSRLAATLGLSVAHFFAGARLFRVHDVAPHRDALAAAASASTQSDAYRTC